jgi:hypothetical protein
VAGIVEHDVGEVLALTHEAVEHGLTLDGRIEPSADPNSHSAGVVISARYGSGPRTQGRARGGWGTGESRGKTENTTFTFTVHGTGDDGSTFKHHETAHSNTRPDGSVQEFFRCRDS